MSEHMIKRWDHLPSWATVTDLLNFLIERGLDTSEVQFTGTTHIRWESPQTEAEKAKEAEWRAERERKQAEWDRKKYAELYERYGGKPPEEVP